MFECKVCKEKEKQINYLQAQIDRLLFRMGIPNVDQEDDIEDDDPVKEDDDTSESFGGLT